MGRHSRTCLLRIALSSYCYRLHPEIKVKARCSCHAWRHEFTMNAHQIISHWDLSSHGCMYVYRAPAMRMYSCIHVTEHFVCKGFLSAPSLRDDPKDPWQISHQLNVHFLVSGHVHNCFMLVLVCIHDYHCNHNSHADATPDWETSKF